MKPLRELALALGPKAPERVALDWRVVRTLEPQDLPEILKPLPVPSSAVGRLRELHSLHHMTAMMLAHGDAPQAVALASGYSTGYISTLKGDPMFQELVEYYRIQREQIFLDLAEREKNLGIRTLEELQRRLEEDPDGWTKKELMELYDRLKPSAPRGGSAAPQLAPAVALQVNFVTPRARRALPEIEAKAVELTE